MYSGPLPPSNEFERYDKALPGAAERILALAEREAEHRHKIEDKAVKLSRAGQISALIVSILSLGAVGLSIYFAQPVASIAPAIVAITGLISVFTGRKKD
jgi:uncharacterized membrane protein